MTKKQSKLRAAQRYIEIALEVSPVVVPAALASFSAVAIIFLLLGEFEGYYVWPLGLLAAAIASYVIVRHYPINETVSSKSRRIVNVLVILGVLVWGVVNIFYTSQHLLVNRDPALYSNAGIWLIEHDNLTIPALNTFGDVPGVQVDAGTGFKPVQDSAQEQIYAQGLHLLPAFIGLAGQVVGVADSLHVNILFGMSALLAIYAFGRALVRRAWWAAVATGAIAVSMPMLNFSRDTYSEPLAATFTFGGLAMVWLALKSEKLSLWFLAGLVFGAGALARIDAYLVVAEILAFLAIMLALSLKSERKQAMKQSAALAAGMAVTSVLGWLDLSQLSTAYYLDQWHNFSKELGAIITVVVLGVAGVYVAWRTNLLIKLDKATKQWRAPALASAVALGIIVLLSRPLWFWYEPMTRKGFRSYTELSAEWIPWYIGSVLATLGAIGIIMAVAKVMKKRDLLLIAGLLVVVGTALLYIIKPSIARDHIWAVRRFLPVILPGVAVFGAVALDWLSDQYLHKFKWSYVFAGLASVAIILVPLTVSKPQLRLSSFEQLGAIKTMCDALPEDAAVLWLGDRESQTIVMPTRAVCGVPSQGFQILQGTDSLSQSKLAALSSNARQHDKVPVIGIYKRNLHLLPGAVSNNMRPVATLQNRQLEHTLTHAPENIVTESTTFYLAKIQPDGRVVPLKTQ